MTDKRYTADELRAMADSEQVMNLRIFRMLQQAAEDCERLALIDAAWDAEVAFNEVSEIYRSDFSDENYEAYEKARLHLKACRDALYDARTQEKANG